MVADETTDRSGDRAALQEAIEDRRWLARRIHATTPVFALAQAACFALMIAAPAAGFTVTTVLLLAGAVFGFLGVETLYRRRLGVSIDWPAGVGSWILIGVLGAVALLLTLASAVLELIGLGGWITLTTAIGFVVAFVGVIFYDRVYESELVRQVAIAAAAVGDVRPETSRFRISAFLRPLSAARISTLRDAIGDDAAVTTDIDALARLGLVTITPSSDGGSVALTKAGKQTFDRRLASLRD